MARAQLSATHAPLQCRSCLRSALDCSTTTCTAETDCCTEPSELYCEKDTSAGASGACVEVGAWTAVPSCKRGKPCSQGGVVFKPPWLPRSASTSTILDAARLRTAAATAPAEQADSAPGTRPRLCAGPVNL